MSSAPTTGGRKRGQVSLRDRPRVGCVGNLLRRRLQTKRISSTPAKSIKPSAHFSRFWSSIPIGRNNQLYQRIPVYPGSYYVMDRGYLDFLRLHRLHAAGAFFVTRLKTNTRYYVVASRPVAADTGLRCDQTIRLNSAKGRHCYPAVVRRISYIDPETGLWLIFFTNQFALDPLTVALIYKHRWKIELFFRWIKQHLRLRGFFSTDPNGVRVQIWTALCAYLLVAIAKRENALPGSLHQVLQVISIAALEKLPLPELFAKLHTTNDAFDTGIQLEISGF